MTEFTCRASNFSDFSFPSWKGACLVNLNNSCLLLSVTERKQSSIPKDFQSSCGVEISTYLHRAFSIGHLIRILRRQWGKFSFYFYSSKCNGEKYIGHYKLIMWTPLHHCETRKGNKCQIFPLHKRDSRWKIFCPYCPRQKQAWQ